MEEMTKLTMASASLAVSCSFQPAKFQTILKDCGWTLSSCLLVAGLPAAIYAIQGVLYIFSYQNLDSVTFNGLAQTKTLWTALCCYAVLGQGQGPAQIVALVVLAVSALIFQGTAGKMMSRYLQQHYKQNPQDGDNGSKMEEEEEAAAASSTRFSLGVVPCLAASFLSGLAGSLSQKGLQLSGGAGRNASLYTIEVSGFSALCLLASTVFGNIKGRMMAMDHRQEEESSFLPNEKQAIVSPPPSSSQQQQQQPFEYWSVSTFYPIVLKAIGGVLTVLVHKHAGSVVKGFALTCGLVLSGVIQAMVDKESISLEQMVGILLVNVSSWMHFTNPKLF